MPGFESLPLITVIWIALVLGLAGVVQGALGLGFPMLATPMIAAVTDMRTAVIVVLLPCVATTVTNIAMTGQFLPTLRRFWFMPLCMLIGAAIGARLFVAYPGFPFALLLAGVIVLYLYLDHLGHVEWAFVSRHRVASGIGFALLAGLSEGSANVAAPPLLMYMFSLNVDRMVFVQVLNLCFTVGKPTQMAILTMEGGVTWTQWAITLPFAAIATATTIIGIKNRHRIDALTYRRWLLRLLFVIALVLVMQFAFSV
ncbi:MAG: sulfite exporter TauE/SafE family protein [Burkholderiales bacterium]